MASAHLTVNERHASDQVVLTLMGELDIATVPVLHAAVRRGRVNGVARIVLDLSQVSFCDSQGLSALIALSKELRAAGGQLVLTDLGDFMLRLLDVTGVRPAFVIE